MEDGLHSSQRRGNDDYDDRATEQAKTGRQAGFQEERKNGKGYTVRGSAADLVGQLRDRAGEEPLDEKRPAHDADIKLNKEQSNQMKTAT